MTNFNAKITHIIYMGSVSGNSGCTNGNYDEKFTIVFSDRTSTEVMSCRCGNGCNGSFPINYLGIGDTYSVFNYYLHREG